LRLVILPSWVKQPDDGIQFIRQLSSDPQQFPLPVVLIGGLEDLQSDGSLAADGRVKILHWPFDLDELMVVVASTESA
jgi:CheY-like chemotaxis protein